jgi:hypothetical protein
VFFKNYSFADLTRGLLSQLSTSSFDSEWIIQENELARLRAALDYGGEGHRSRILGGFYNMIGRKWDSCPVEVYTTVKNPLVEYFAHGWKNDMAASVATFLTRSSLEVKFLGQPQSLGQETWPPENSNLNKILSKHVLFSTFQGHFWRLGACFQAFSHAPTYSTCSVLMTCLISKRPLFAVGIIGSHDVNFHCDFLKLFLEVRKCTTSFLWI